LKRFSSQDAILSTASNPPSPRKSRTFRHEIIDSDSFLPTPTKSRPFRHEVIDSDAFLPTKSRLIRHDVIDNDDIVFLPTASRRSSSRMSTESEELEKSRQKQKYRPTNLRRCSDGAAFSARQTLHGRLYKNKHYSELMNYLKLKFFRSNFKIGRIFSD
jgi:hypothetical protein